MAEVQSGMSLLHAFAPPGPPGLWQQAKCLLLMRMAAQRVKSNSCQSCDLYRFIVSGDQSYSGMLPNKSNVSLRNLELPDICLQQFALRFDSFVGAISKFKPWCRLQTFVKTFRAVLLRERSCPVRRGS